MPIDIKTDTKRNATREIGYAMESVKQRRCMRP